MVALTVIVAALPVAAMARKSAKQAPGNTNDANFFMLR
jgi:hypothetical protein